jgi:hypothetical protein
VEKAFDSLSMHLFPDFFQIGIQLQAGLPGQFRCFKDRVLVRLEQLLRYSSGLIKK